MSEKNEICEPTKKTNSGASLFDSCNEAKENQNNENFFMNNISENHPEKKENLIEGLKDSYVKLYYNLLELKFEYKEIKIGGKPINHIKDIEKKGNQNFKIINGYIKFLEEIEKKVEIEYNKKYEFLLELFIKGDKDKNSNNFECKYVLKISGKTSQYIDYDIINNGTSNGFNYLLDYLNNFSDKKINNK